MMTMRVPFGAFDHSFALLYFMLPVEFLSHLMISSVIKQRPRRRNQKKEVGGGSSEVNRNHRKTIERPAKEKEIKARSGFKISRNRIRCIGYGMLFLATIMFQRRNFQFWDDDDAAWFGMKGLSKGRRPVPAQVHAGYLEWNPVKTQWYMINVDTASIKSQGKVRYYDEIDDDYPSFNDLVYTPLGSISLSPDKLNQEELFRQGRLIDPLDDIRYQGYRKRTFRNIDEPEINPMYEPDEDVQAEATICHRTTTYKLNYYTCNNVHELTVGRTKSRVSNTEFVAQYLGHGAFRDAWKMYGSSVSDDFVLKMLRLNDRRGGLRDMHLVARDATVMERLTASPNIVNIYGFCSTTILAENIEEEVSDLIVPMNGLIDQEILDAEPDAIPRNDFTVREKLQMALEMAQGLADLHGFKDGVMFHGDTHPEQWLRAKNGRLKLNDFNNAMIMDYSPSNQVYCKPFRDFGGFYRSPEEFIPDHLNEKCDIFSMGNNIYCLLTGLWPFYNEVDFDNYKPVQERLVQGQRAHVDPRWRKRSVAEDRMVDIIQLSWNQSPKYRISIFEMIQKLEEAIDEYDASIQADK